MFNRTDDSQRNVQHETLPEAEFGASSLATMEPEEAPSTGSAKKSGPCCAKCEAPLQSGVVTICRNCGWYASLNMFVEVDRDWEIATDQTEVAATAPQPVSHVQFWFNLVPRWGWVIIASLLVVIVESVAARFVTPADSWARTTWSLSQLALGVLAAVGCHVFNFLVFAADDAEIGLLDIFLKPIKLWDRALQNLPTRLWMVDAAACGIVAAIMSIVVIGGIPYERLWDWGFEEPVKQNLMGAVMDRAKQLDSGAGSDNLEDAIGDFAGTQDVDGEAVKPEPAKPRNRMDCVILGYRVDRDGRLDSLVLGAVYRGDLVFAGSVAPTLPEDERSELLASLKSIPAKQAFIHVESEAIWVQPKYTCRVTFAEQQKNGRLRDIQWDKSLGKMQTP